MLTCMPFRAGVSCHRNNNGPQPDDCDFCNLDGSREDEYPCFGNQFYGRGPLQVLPKQAPPVVDLVSN